MGKKTLLMVMALSFAALVPAQQNKQKQRVTTESVLRGNSKQSTAKKPSAAKRNSSAVKQGQKAPAASGKTAAKGSSAVGKTSAGKAKKQTAKTQAAAVRLGSPVVVDGHLALLGVPLGQSKGQLRAQLRQQGLDLAKDEADRQCLIGRVFGVQANVYVESKRQVSVREEKSYGKTQARERVQAYQKAFLKDASGRVADNTMSSNSSEGGTVVIECDAGVIEVGYYNQDEVNFSSSSYDVIVTLIDG